MDKIIITKFTPIIDTSAVPFHRGQCEWEADPLIELIYVTPKTYLLLNKRQNTTHLRFTLRSDYVPAPCTLDHALLII